MFLNQRIDELNEFASLLDTQGKRENADFLRSTAETLKYQDDEINRIRDVVQEVLQDSESQEGGWGPDVTMVEKLRSAMPKIVEA